MIYLLKCEAGSGHRYYSIYEGGGLACTREELPREVAFRRHVPPIHVTACEWQPDRGSALAAARDWMRGVS